MIVLVQANVMTVGLGERNSVLQELPLRVISMHLANNAVSSLKTEKVDSVISQWELEDSKDGDFLRRFRIARPGIPTIVLVESGNEKQESAARSLGVSAVLTNDCSDELFAQTVANVLGLKGRISVKSISPAHKRKDTGKPAVKRASGVESLRNR